MLHRLQGGHSSGRACIEVGDRADLGFRGAICPCDIERVAKGRAQGSDADAGTGVRLPQRVAENAPCRRRRDQFRLHDVVAASAARLMRWSASTSRWRARSAVIPNRAAIRAMGRALSAGTAHRWTMMNRRRGGRDSARSRMTAGLIEVSRGRSGTGRAAPGG